jgi:hypothetical protein
VTPAAVRTLPPAERLLYWITEREAIRLRKEVGAPAPWTDDEILRTYRFCNVRRMDDRVSRWLMKLWYGPHRGHPNTLVGAALARFFNQPGTLAYIQDYVWNRPRLEWTKMAGELKRLRGLGPPVFNAAYIVSTNGRRADKIDHVLGCVRGLLGTEDVIVRPDSMEDTWRALRAHYGFGSFMAGQVVADLRHAVPGKWEDAPEWAPVGPGSLRGLRRLYAGDATAVLHRTPPETLNMAINEMYEALTGHHEIYDRVEGMDLQNCLCEWDKYERALWGEGRPKQRYPGGAA